VRIAIFLGPSLPVAEAQAILDAEYLPPAREAQIATLAAQDDKPDIIGLIDGVFMSSLSVWHNEILYALQRGVRIYGASSMGALRAAETAAYGMVGVGEIYRMYAEGILEDDDEVALTHASGEQGYRATSEPLVNIRATLAEAVGRGQLANSIADELLSIAKSLYFPDRTLPGLLDLARERGMQVPELHNVEAIFAQNYVDLKRRDAIDLLKTIAALPQTSIPAQPSFEFNPSYVFETLYNRDRDVRHGGTEIPISRIASYTILHHPNFSELNTNAFNRVMALVLANLIGVTANDTEIDGECEKFLSRNNLEADESAVTNWCSRNNVNAKEFRMLMRESAVCRKLHRWMMTNRFLDRNTRFLLDYMRLNNTYGEWAEMAGDQELTLQRNYPEFSECCTENKGFEELIRRHQASTDWTIERDVVSWCEDYGFQTAEDLKLELQRADQYRRIQTRVKALLLQAADLFESAESTVTIDPKPATSKHHGIFDRSC
jgi:hypothetical protein